MKNTVAFLFAFVLAAPGCSSDEAKADAGGGTVDQGPGTADQQVPLPVQSVSTSDQGGGSGSNGGCDVDVAGKQSCVDYVGQSYAPGPALNATKGACTAGGGTWNDQGCAASGTQGHCTWFEGQDTEHIYYFYNYSADDLAKERKSCEDNADRTWHDA